MEHRILLVEDDRSLADAICAQMKLWALECTCVADFRAVMAEFARVQPHLVLMDVSLPYMSGYHWCAEIRKVSSVPVIFISSASDNMNIIMAMNMGGDDFVAKPFDTNVLIAKVQALLRRTYEFGAAAPVLEHAGAILNTGDNTLTYADEHIALTKNEYRILLTLMQNKGKIVSREKLMEALWQTDSFVDENTLTVNVGRLRKKLENAGLRDFITTKFGVGYAVAYPCTLALLLGLAALALDFRRVYKLHRELSQLETTAAELIGVLPAAASVPEADYQAVVQSLCRQSADAAAKAAADRADMLEYYTLWAHQIKTPIAAMRLRLQSEDSDSSRRLLADLGRIEQYVEMVLAYLRLEGEGTDYVFREARLDDIVRPALRRFAGEFIARRLTLDYTPTDVRVFTDEKWLSFVIEQVLSNALKYTPQGGVSVYVEEPKTLCICDTGIGIAPEDLPRVFERGFTGLQGRADKRASGIGLYLCRRICRNLGHTITAESRPGEGTTVRIKLEEKKITVE